MTGRQYVRESLAGLAAYLVAPLAVAVVLAVQGVSGAVSPPAERTVTQTTIAVARPAVPVAAQPAWCHR